jgi:hypothetical protein
MIYSTRLCLVKIQTRKNRQLALAVLIRFSAGRTISAHLHGMPLGVLRQWEARMETVEICCRNCGFLALRNAETMELPEADSHFRDTGGLRNSIQQRSFEPRPVCFVRANNLPVEVGETHPVDIVKKVIQESRDCDCFMEWQQGFTPKEHFEMNLLQKERERQDQRDKDDREWRTAQAEQAHRWHQEDMALARESMRTGIRTSLLAAIIGFVAAIVAVLLTWFLAGLTVAQ